MLAVEIAPIAEIPEGTARTYEVAGHRIAIIHAAGQVYALDDICSHADASLGSGEVDEDELTVECPLHGSVFGLDDGKPRTLPAFAPVNTYPARVVDGTVFVEYPS